MIIKKSIYGIVLYISIFTIMYGTVYSQTGNNDHSADSISQNINGSDYRFSIQLEAHLGNGFFSGGTGNIVKTYRSISIGIGFQYNQAFLNFVLDLGPYGKLTDEYYGYFEGHYSFDTFQVKMLNYGLEAGYNVNIVNRIVLAPYIGIYKSGLQGWSLNRLEDDQSLTHNIGLGLKIKVLVRNDKEKRVKHYLFVSPLYRTWNLPFELTDGESIVIKFGYIADICLW